MMIRGKKYSELYFAGLKLTSLSVGTQKHCVFGHLRLVFIWTCLFFVLFLLFYVISAAVPAEETKPSTFRLEDERFVITRISAILLGMKFSKVCILGIFEFSLMRKMIILCVRVS